MIDSFSGKYRFLSNFVPCEVELDGKKYPSVEAAYQAAKTIVGFERVPFQSMGPVEAKRAGKCVTLRADWPDVKIGIMFDLCRQKFSQSNYKMLLLDTGDQEILEGNYWNDTFWGVCRGQGRNELGKILMGIRADLLP